MSGALFCAYPVVSKALLSPPPFPGAAYQKFCEVAPAAVGEAEKPRPPGGVCGTSEEKARGRFFVRRFWVERRPYARCQEKAAATCGAVSLGNASHVF